MKRTVFAIAIAATALATVSGSSQAAPIAPLPTAVTADHRNVTDVRWWGWHAHWGWHPYWHRPWGWRGPFWGWPWWHRRWGFWWGWHHGWHHCWRGHYGRLHCRW
jgi:hypothetical protein